MTELIHTFKIRNLFSGHVFLGSVVCVIHRVVVFTLPESPPPSSQFGFSQTRPLGGASRFLTSPREACPSQLLLPDWPARAVAILAVRVVGVDPVGVEGGERLEAVVHQRQLQSVGGSRGHGRVPRGVRVGACCEARPVLLGDGTLSAAGWIPTAGGAKKV